MPATSGGHAGERGGAVTAGLGGPADGGSRAWLPRVSSGGAQPRLQRGGAHGQRAGRRGGAVSGAPSARGCADGLLGWRAWWAAYRAASFSRLPASRSHFALRRRARTS